MPPTLGGKSLVTSRWRFTLRHRRDGEAGAAARERRLSRLRAEAQRRDEAGALEHPHGPRLVGVDDDGVVGLAPEEEGDDTVVAAPVSLQRAAVAVDGEPALGLGADVGVAMTDVAMSVCRLRHVACPWKSA